MTSIHLKQARHPAGRGQRLPRPLLRHPEGGCPTGYPQLGPRLSGVAIPLPGLPRQECALENRTVGVLASVEPIEEGSSRLVVRDDMWFWQSRVSALKGAKHGV